MTVSTGEGACVVCFWKNKENTKSCVDDIEHSDLKTLKNSSSKLRNNFSNES